MIGEVGVVNEMFRQRPEGQRLGAANDSPIDWGWGRWWVIHTKPRTEKVLAAHFESMRIQYFLPLARVTRRYLSRAKDVMIPLFPGYLFIRGGLEERHDALQTNRVANVIDVVDQERLKADLRQIYRTVTSNAPVDLYAGIRRGRRCRVVRGCLKGLEGVVMRRRGVCRVYVAVEILGQSAEIELDPGLLEVVG